MAKPRVKLTKWIISKQEDGEITYTKKDPSGRVIISVHEQYDEFAKQLSIAIRYYTKSNGKWGQFIADAVCTKDLADVIVRHWLDKKGYDYE